MKPFLEPFPFLKFVFFKSIIYKTFFNSLLLGFCWVRAWFYNLPGFEQDIAGLMVAWPPLPRQNCAKQKVYEKILHRPTVVGKTKYTIEIILFAKQNSVEGKNCLIYKTSECK